MRNLLNDGRGPIETRLRRWLDRLGVDPYDIDLELIHLHIEVYEREPVSRFWFKSPCWAVRTIDLTVHVYLPAALSEKYPRVALWLLSHSPRLGQTHEVPLAPVKSLL